MRDIVFTALIFGTLPFILRRPWIGAAVFAWLSLMTPYHYCYGFAYSFPFGAVVAGCTVIGLFTSKEEVRYEFNGTMLLMILLPFWMTFTWFFALEPDEGSYRIPELIKIFLMIHVTAMVIRKRQHIEWMLWVIVISIGFFGFKGGLYTLLGRGGKVWGPPGESFLTDNNAISVALVMVIPLMFYLRTIAPKAWMRHALLLAMPLSGMAVLGSYSRGALLAIGAMLTFLWMKSRQKIALALLMIPLAAIGVSMMPAKWTDRMHSIQTYEQDGSAMGRINAWHAAFNLANDRPLVGGGYEYYTLKTFAKYAPNPIDVHSAHSIYFQMLGEHGYVGLFIFLGIGVAAWRRARKVIATAENRPDLRWASVMARCLQVSIFGYAVGGAFINIGYWDLIYLEVVLLVALNRLATLPTSAPALAPAAAQAA